MLDDFLIRAALAGVGVALAAGPLGCFVVWRRMAYFGDATAHAAILGVALALAVELPAAFGILVAALAMGLAINAVSERGGTFDAALGILGHTALALGLVGISLFAAGPVNVQALLFGDILAVTRGDLAVIWGGSLAVVGLLVWRWQALLTATLSAELATASGVDPKREQVLLTLALAVVVAVAIKVVGALLISAMLLIPAGIARVGAGTPERMAVGAAIAGVLAVLGGLAGSLAFDTPTGPSIVVAAALGFIVALGIRRAV